MAISLRTVINKDVTISNQGNVKQVQSGIVNITSVDQTVFFSTISSTDKAYIVATFKADSIYTQTGFTTNINSTQSFVFSAGGQTGALSWQVIEVY